MVTLHTAQAGEKGGNTGLLLFGLLAAAAAGYYFLVYKPEQDALAAKGK